MGQHEKAGSKVGSCWQETSEMSAANAEFFGVAGSKSFIARSRLQG